MSESKKIKRGEFVKEFLANMERILMRELPPEGTNEDLIDRACTEAYKRLLHVREGIRAVQENRGGRP